MPPRKSLSETISEPSYERVSDFRYQLGKASVLRLLIATIAEDKRRHLTVNCSGDSYADVVDRCTPRAATGSFLKKYGTVCDIESGITSYEVVNARHVQ